MNEISVIDGAPSRRRRYPLDFKRRIVLASLAPGASIARVARENGLNANQLFNWRHQYRQGKLGAFGAGEAGALVPIRVMPEPVVALTSAASLELILPKGRLRIEGRPDRDTVLWLIEALGGC